MKKLTMFGDGDAKSKREFFDKIRAKSIMSDITDPI